MKTKLLALVAMLGLMSCERVEYVINTARPNERAVIQFSTTPYMVYHVVKVGEGAFEYWMKLPESIPGDKTCWILKTDHPLNQGDQIIIAPYKSMPQILEGVIPNMIIPPSVKPNRDNGRGMVL